MVSQPRRCRLPCRLSLLRVDLFGVSTIPERWSTPCTLAVDLLVAYTSCLALRNGRMLFYYAVGFPMPSSKHTLLALTRRSASEFLARYCDCRGEVQVRSSCRLMGSAPKGGHCHVPCHFTDFRLIDIDLQLVSSPPLRRLMDSHSRDPIIIIPHSLFIFIPFIPFHSIHFLISDF